MPGPAESRRASTNQASGHPAPLGPLDAQWPTSHKSCSGTLRTCRLRPHEQVNYHPLPAGQRKIPPAGSPTMMVSLTSKCRTSRARPASMPLGSSAADKKCLYSNPTGVQARNPPHTHDVTIDTAQYGKNASVALAFNLPSSTPVRVDHRIPCILFFQLQTDGGRSKE